MKRFVKLALCLFLCVIAIGLTACGGKKKEVVDTSIASYGNGGMVVTHGEYVYFVNGYSSYEIYTKDNLSTNFDVGGLYRAKLNSDKTLNYDKNGNVVGAEKLSGNLVGFETTSLYIFGDYIYYVTPTTEVDKQGNLQTSKLDFCRIKIDGGKTERVYKSNSDAADIDFEFYYAEGQVYLLVNENGTLKRIICSGKFSVDTIDENVTSVALHKDEYNVFDSDSYKNIFYTKTNNDEKIEIYNYNVVSNKQEYKVTTNYSTCELMDYRFGHLYYKASKEDYPSYTYVYRIDATKNAITNLIEEQITKMEYTEFYFLENETSGYIAQTEDKTYYLTYDAGGLSQVIPIADSKLNIMAIKNNYIYINESSEIKRINIYNLSTSHDTTQETVLTLENMQTYQYDIDDHYIYMYATMGENTYLYGIYINNPIDGDEFEAKLIGVYLESDIEESEE